MGEARSPTASTLTASERKILEVLHALQRLGFVPHQPHTMYDPGRVVHHDPVSEQVEGHTRIKFIRERCVRIEWGGMNVSHALELTLQDANNHGVLKTDDVLTASKQVLEAHTQWRQQDDSGAEYRWGVIRLSITQKYASGGLLEPKFVLDDPTSIQFLLSHGRAPERCGCGYGY